MSLQDYKKVKGCPGITKHNRTGNFRAKIWVEGKLRQKTFPNLFQARKWIDSAKAQKKEKNLPNFSTLKQVWETFLKEHCCGLATNTVEIWKRRYGYWQNIENLPMDQITPSKVSKWVGNWVSHFKSDEYESLGRGRSGRCNLDNELNMFITIFNWYKESEEFEKEAQCLTSPIKKKHKQQGFVKPVPKKNKQIPLEAVLLFFDHLQPLYKSLATMQFLTAARIGEVTGMQWKNIDMLNRRLAIKETCIWDPRNKVFKELKGFPKNKEVRVCYITFEIMEILKERSGFRIPGNDFVFHVEGRPLNYCTIQVNYRGAQRKANLPYSGTHILRHGMAKLARKVGGGVDSVMAMTGHKDMKLADHYSKSDEADQKEISELVMQKIREVKNRDSNENGKVLSLTHYKRGGVAFK